MRPVLSTTDRALVESLVLFLEADGIEALVTNDAGGLPFIPTTVAVIDDAQYERALELAHEAQANRQPSPQPAPRRQRVYWLLMILLFALLGLCGQFLF